MEAYENIITGEYGDVEGPEVEIELRRLTDLIEALEEIVALANSGGPRRTTRDRRIGRIAKTALAEARRMGGVIPGQKDAAADVADAVVRAALGS